MLTRYDLCRSFFGDVCQHEVGHNAHIGSREELDQVGNQTNVGRSADAVDVVSTRGSQSSRGASSESQGLLNKGEGAIGSSTFAFNVELVGGPGELGVLISRKHMEAVVEGLHSAVDVVPGAERAGSSCSGGGSSCSGSSSSGGGGSRSHCGGGDLIVT
jgi:hypothetical protein